MYVGKKKKTTPLTLSVAVATSAHCHTLPLLFQTATAKFGVCNFDVSTFFDVLTVA